MDRPKRSLDQPAHGEWADLRDSLEVAVDVNDAEPVVQGRASDEEIRDRRSVPHAVVVSQIPLEIVSALEEPTPHRHISSDASRATSTRRLNCSR